MGQQAADKLPPRFRQDLPLARWREGIACGLSRRLWTSPQRLVQVPAVGKNVGQCRSAHESGVIPLTSANLLNGTTEQHHRVCSFQSGTRMQGQFELTRTELHLDGAQRQPEFH